MKQQLKSTVRNKTQWGWRIFIYAVGIIILALGVTLNTKTGLGVSPLISVPYSLATINNMNVGNITFVYCCLITSLELIIAGKKRRWTDLLQIPFSVVFTRFMNLFSGILDFTLQHFWQQLLVLIVVVVFTGIGVSMSVNMRLIPNPCDGFVHLAGELSGKNMGLVKNVFDICNVGITFVIGILGGQFLIGIGLGTIITMLAVGRVVAVFNSLTKSKLETLAGLKL